MPRRERDDQIAMITASPLPGTIRPPFGSRAKAETARSISTGVAHVDRVDLHPERWRYGLDGAEWPLPAVWAVSRRTATRVTPGAICLSSSSHFPLRLNS